MGESRVLAVMYLHELVPGPLHELLAFFAEVIEGSVDPASWRKKAP